MPNKQLWLFSAIIITWPWWGSGIVVRTESLDPESKWHILYHLQNNEDERGSRRGQVLGRRNAAGRGKGRWKAPMSKYLVLTSGVILHHCITLGFNFFTWKTREIRWSLRLSWPLYSTKFEHNKTKHLRKTLIEHTVPLSLALNSAEWSSDGNVRHIPVLSPF